MKKKRKWLKWVILLAALAVMAVVFMLPKLRTASESLYKSETVTRGSISTYYSFSGSVKLARSESHSALSACEVREVYVSEGDRVKKDDRLMRLSDGRTLKAGMDGEVTDVAFEKDDNVAAGQTLVEIADFDSMRIEFDVDEFDVDAVSVGADARVTIDALDCEFISPITRVSKIASTVGDIAYYSARVEPDMDALPDGILPGMRVDVKVTGACADDALMIKMDALSFDEYNKPYVLVDGAEGKERRYVETGINDGVYVQITGGLSEGETAYYTARLTELEEMMKMRSSMVSGSK